MYVVAVDWQTRPDSAEAFATLLREQARNSLAAEPDCHRFDICQDPAAPETFFLYELYTDKAAFEAHLTSPHMQDFAPQADALTARKTVRTFTLL